MSPAITAVKGGLLHLQYIKFLSSKVIYQHQDMAKSLEALFFPDSNLTKNRQKDYKIVFDIAKPMLLIIPSMKTMSTNLVSKFHTLELTVDCSRTMHSFQPSETCECACDN